MLAHTGPVLVFLVAMTVLAELADRAQLFDVVASRAGRLARGSTPLLFTLVVLVATATTVVLSLDTTAVLLTPAVLSLTASVGLDPWPFALATVWLANTASLLLPVSNLTNLLALDRLDLTTGAYAARLALPALVAVLVTSAAVGVLHRRRLTGRHPLPVPVVPEDRVLCGAAAVCAVALVPVLSFGVEPAWAATGAAVALAVVFLWRRRSALTPGLVPWRLLVGVSVLFALVGALGPHGLDSLLRQLVGGPLQTAFVAAGASNLVDNLPSYLALERVVPHEHLTAVLLGTNLGPLVTPWGSLATLLWADRCRARGVRVDWLRFAAAGLGVAPLLLLATVPLL